MFAWGLASQVEPAGQTASNSERLDHLLDLAILGVLNQRQLQARALFLVLAPLFKAKTDILEGNLGKGKNPADAFSTTATFEVDNADLAVLVAAGSLVAA